MTIMLFKTLFAAIPHNLAFASEKHHFRLFATSTTYLYLLGFKQIAVLYF
jgi:hypothetical protein